MPITTKPSAVAKPVAMIAPRSIWRRSAAAVISGSTVKRVTGGTAVMMPIQVASIPIAFSHTVKNGRCTPVMPNSVA